MSTKVKQPEKIELDIRGPQGQEFHLISLVREFATITGEDAQSIIDEMIKGDYEHLLLIFQRHFGSFVTLNR